MVRIFYWLRRAGAYCDGSLFRALGWLERAGWTLRKGSPLDITQGLETWRCSPPCVIDWPLDCNVYGGPQLDRLVLDVLD